MWTLLALVLSLGLFSMLSLMHMHQSEERAFHVAEKAMETQSAQQMQIFTSSAWAYAGAQGLPSGKTISVDALINAGYLPQSFDENNAFGQELEAVTGQGSLVSYYKNPPSTLYGTPVTSQTEEGVAMAIAERLSAMQENSPQYVAAISNNGGSGSDYNLALMPYAQTAITMSSNDPAFNTAFPSLLDMVNVLPSTSINSGSASAATTSTCGSPVSYSSPGVYTVSVPSCAKDIDATVSGGGGAGGGDGSLDSQGGNGDSVSGDFPVTQGESIEVVVGGGAPDDSNGSGGGGGLSGIFSGTPSSSNAIIVAGGGGGGANADSNTQYNGTNGGFNPVATTQAYQSGGNGFGGAGLGYNAAGNDGSPFSTGGASAGIYSSNGGFGGGASGGSAWGGGGGGGGLPGGSGGYGNSNGVSYGGQGGTSYVSSSVTNVADGTGGLGSALGSPGGNGSVSLSFTQ